jgi:hypothetical protein
MCSAIRNSKGVGIRSVKKNFCQRL